jgi:hypothetical protein
MAEHAPATPLTPAQRRGIVWIGLIIAALAIGRSLFHRATVNDPPEARADRYIDLQDRLDLNTASVADLAAIPMLGESKAELIVADRERRRQRDPQQPPFRHLNDLLRIDGIGVQTLRHMEPYITLSPLAATRPATP